MPIPRPGSAVRGSRTGRPVMAVLDVLGRRWGLRIAWELRGEALPGGGQSDVREMRRRLREDGEWDRSCVISQETSFSFRMWASEDRWASPTVLAATELLTTRRLGTSEARNTA